MKKSLQRLKKLAKDNRGAGYIETIIYTMVIAFAISLIVSLIGLSATYAKVQSFASATAENAAASGQICTDTVTELKEKSGLETDKISCVWNADYFDQSSDKLAFRKEFTVKVTYPYSLLGINIPITYTGRGMSGVYFK